MNTIINQHINQNKISKFLFSAIIKYMIFFIVFFITINSTIAENNTSELQNNNRPDDSNNKLNKNLVSNFIVEMARAINSRDYETINSFFQYNTEKEASFIITSYLYQKGQEEPVAKEEKTLNKEKFVKYIYDIIKASTDYSYGVSINDIKVQDANYAATNFEIKELQLQKILKKVSKKDNSGKEKIEFENGTLKVISYSTCNANFVFGSNLLLSGMNCIESIASTVE